MNLKIDDESKLTAYSGRIFELGDKVFKEVENVLKACCLSQVSAESEDAVEEVSCFVI